MMRGLRCLPSGKKKFFFFLRHVHPISSQVTSPAASITTRWTATSTLPVVFGGQILFFFCRAVSVKGQLVFSHSHASTVDDGAEKSRPCHGAALPFCDDEYLSLSLPPNWGKGRRRQQTFRTKREKKCSKL